MEWPKSWAQPERLKMLEGTPINCLLLAEPAAPAFREAAARAGVEVIEPGGKQVAWALWKEIDWAKPPEPVAIKDGFWPQLARKKGDEADAGPTGAPWLDSNGWIIQLARSRAPGRTVWLKSDPPEAPQNVMRNSFILAVAEAWVFGARRPVWIPEPRFEETWKPMVQALSWMAERRAWGEWTVPAGLLVVSDFSGANEYMSTEVLNLAARQNLPFNACERSSLDAASLRAKRAVLWVDPQLPDAAHLKLLRSFVDAGGLLLCSKAVSASFAKLTPGTADHPRFTFATLGKGRVAASKQDFDDPWILAADAHLLMSRRWDEVRLFNGTSVNWHYTVSPDGKRAVMHLLNYSLRGAGNQVTAQFLAPARAASWHVPSKAAAEPLEIRRPSGRQEVWLPSFDLYAAVELELRG
jgi:hypothetical protein